MSTSVVENDLASSQPPPQKPIKCCYPDDCSGKLKRHGSAPDLMICGDCRDHHCTSCVKCYFGDYLHCPSCNIFYCWKCPNYQAFGSCTRCLEELESWL